MSDRGVRGGGGQANVQLSYLGAGNAARVGDLGRDRGDVVEEIGPAAGDGLALSGARRGVARDFDILKGEVGVSWEGEKG